MKWVYRITLWLHLFVGIGGMAGGLAAILDPVQPLGVPAETLQNSPFNDFFIPGMILFSVIGLGNVLSGIALMLKFKYQGYMSGILGGALVIWIVVQCIMLYAVAFLHVLFFIIGLVQAGLALAIMFERRLFPVNILLKIVTKR